MSDQVHSHENPCERCEVKQFLMRYYFFGSCPYKCERKQDYEIELVYEEETAHDDTDSDSQRETYFDKA